MGRLGDEETDDHWLPTGLGRSDCRDERGAYGNVSFGWGYTGTSSGNAETDKPLPKVARAVFLPDLYKVGIWGL
jgi:hypothetical protein